MPKSILGQIPNLIEPTKLRQQEEIKLYDISRLFTYTLDAGIVESGSVFLATDLNTTTNWTFEFSSGNDVSVTMDFLKIKELAILSIYGYTNRGVGWGSGNLYLEHSVDGVSWTLDRTFVLGASTTYYAFSIGGFKFRYFRIRSNLGSGIQGIALTEMSILERFNELLI